MTEPKPELESELEPSSGPEKPIDRFFQPSRALLAVSVLLPAILLALAAWQGYRVALRETATRVERNSLILNEHAVKVFETHKLVVDEVNSRLARINLNDPEQAHDFYLMLGRIQREFDQVATITITNAQGRMIGSGRTFPFDPTITFDDRDWFQALKKEDLKIPYVSRSYTGRQSGQSVFNVALRIRGPDPSVFYGAIAVSVDRKYFEKFYRDVESGSTNDIVLFRRDGQILAHEPVTGKKVIADAAEISARISAAPGDYLGFSKFVDGVSEIAGFRQVADYPVIVGFAVPRYTALAEWRTNVAVYALVAVLAALCLLTVSMMAIRQATRQRLATDRWRETAQDLAAEAEMRSSAESQLRQSQKMEAVGRLTGGVAHDFNNLLTVVLGNLELLGRRLPEGHPRLMQLIDNATNASRRAAGLTARLLAFSRQQPLAPSAIDVNKLISGMSDLLRRTLGEPVEIEVVLGGGLWPAHADPNQLESAILNLAVNARDAMPEGGKLTIETANSHLDDVYASAHHDVAAGQYVTVCISDTGTGMPADVAASAFEPFFTTKGVGQGTGLGLSQVYGFSKQSGGHAAIYSEIDEGTTIKLYLPRYRGAVEAAGDAPAAAAPAPRATGQLILVVEDDDSVRDFTASALRDSGYRVVHAHNADEALRLFEQHPDIALLFTDIVLTGSMNGRKLADEITGLRPDLPVLFTTGYTRNAIIHHGRLDEGIAFIGKPFTVQALSVKVSEVLAASARDSAHDSSPGPADKPAGPGSP